MKFLLPLVILGLVVENSIATQFEIIHVKYDTCHYDGCGGTILFTACEDYSMENLISATLNLKLGGDIDNHFEKVRINGAFEKLCTEIGDSHCEELRDCVVEQNVSVEALAGIIKITYDSNHKVDLGCDDKYFNLKDVHVIVEARLTLNYSSPPTTPKGYLQTHTQYSYCKTTGCIDTINFTDYDFNLDSTARLMLEIGGDLNGHDENVFISGAGLQSEVQCDGIYGKCKPLEVCRSDAIDVTEEAKKNSISITYNATNHVSPICDCYYHQNDVALAIEATLYICSPPNPCPDGKKPLLLDFDSLNEGDFFVGSNNDIAQDGYNFSFIGKGCDNVDCSSSAKYCPMIFDSNIDTTNSTEDWDLFINQGNIMIISEDGSTEKPDDLYCTRSDAAARANICINFNGAALDALLVRFADNESGDKTKIQLYSDESCIDTNDIIKSVNVPLQSNKEQGIITIQEVDNMVSAKSMKVIFGGSGAFGDLLFCAADCPDTFVVDTTSNTCVCPTNTDLTNIDDQSLCCPACDPDQERSVVTDANNNLQCDCLEIPEDNCVINANCVGCICPDGCTLGDEGCPSTGRRRALLLGAPGFSPDCEALTPNDNIGPPQTCATCCPLSP
eukprot:CAMPEP_0197309390 /NCGR_PEP_ID=MMETSP0891-20130614/7962_1 /TAXON_ID=44058 ORGANISM="Aureoumbra lagunensis, Strain CCMP1510" /NCGR_SAMPLE_ID=MMETSP0891 /ASSEMBLY_ACC=CAM_ASM_000534 /LENGTH=616 /DNA_ID=CAMNT_0042794423 /DNA_START=42 /DNA_END=1892 /DNA_ORIENTATION=+